jgi:ATP-dependent DNA helicase RecG
MDENYSRVLIEKEDLTLAEVMVLDRIQKGKPVDKAAYMKNKAFDDAHYEKMILDFIKKFGPVTRKSIDELILDKLSGVLSEQQKINKVGNLLGKLRKRNSIENKGSSRKPEWVIALDNNIKSN